MGCFVICFDLLICILCFVYRINEKKPLSFQSFFFKVVSRQVSSSSSLVLHLTTVFRAQSTLETLERQQFLSAATQTSATTNLPLVRCLFPASVNALNNSASNWPICITCYLKNKGNGNWMALNFLQPCEYIITLLSLCERAQRHGCKWP